MSDHEHRAIIRWQRKGADFRGSKYSREHTWTFDGGITVRASASPAIVPVPYSNPACLDPEEAFVAAISSCHMLTFLHLASRKGFAVESYSDEAVGAMTANERGALWISSITLNPTVEHAGKKSPTLADLEELHHLAHEECFLANSIKTHVNILIQLEKPRPGPTRIRIIRRRGRHAVGHSGRPVAAETVQRFIDKSL